MTLFWFNHYGLIKNTFSLGIVRTLSKRNHFSIGCCAKFVRHVRCPVVISHHTCCLSCPHLQELSQQSQLWYHFIFKVNLEEGLLPPKTFLSVASSEALIQRCSLMKYGRFIKKVYQKIFF